MTATLGVVVVVVVVGVGGVVVVVAPAMTSLVCLHFHPSGPPHV